MICRTPVLFNGSQLESQEIHDRFVVSILQFAKRAPCVPPFFRGSSNRNKTIKLISSSHSSMCHPCSKHLETANHVCSLVRVRSPAACERTQATSVSALTDRWSRLTDTVLRGPSRKIRRGPHARPWRSAAVHQSPAASPSARMRLPAPLPVRHRPPARHPMRPSARRRPPTRHPMCSPALPPPARLCRPTASCHTAGCPRVIPRVRGGPPAPPPPAPPPAHPPARRPTRHPMCPPALPPTARLRRPAGRWRTAGGARRARGLMARCVERMLRGAEGPKA
jgi:hypothetical protein